MDRATRKFKKLPLMRLSVAPLTACAANGNRVFMSPSTVNSTVGPRLKVVSLDYSDSLWAMTFQPDQSLLVTQKKRVLQTLH